MCKESTTRTDVSFTASVFFYLILGGQDRCVGWNHHR